MEPGDGRKYLPFEAFQPALALVALLSTVALVIAVGVRIYPLLSNSAVIPAVPRPTSDTPTPPAGDRQGVTQSPPAGTSPSAPAPTAQSPAQQSAPPAAATVPNEPGKSIDNSSKK
jgi:hypothetical protein